MGESKDSDSLLPKGSTRYLEFPFLCDDVRLKDTKSSLESGIKLSLAHYQEARECYVNEEYYRALWRQREAESAAEEQVLEIDRESLSENHVVGSPGNKPVIRFLESDTQNEPGAIARRVREALVSSSAKNEPAVDAEVENYVINCVAQREPRSHKWDDEDLVAYVGDLMTEKYFDDHIDDFVDAVTSHMYFNVMLYEPLMLKRIECPNFYSKYILVWKYDGDFHNMYDSQCFIDDYFSRLHVLSGDYWGNMRELLQKNGVLMNVDKFRHYFRRSQTQGKLEFVEMDETSIYLSHEGSVANMEYSPSFETSSESSVPRSAKAVHFEPAPRLLHINQQEAPAYVYLDAVE